MNFGSVCSGIEASSVAFNDLSLKPLWFSEIAEFPSQVLKYHYPDIINLGDMNNIAEQIRKNIIIAPDMLCGGTPCQAFSLAGWRKGLVDKRGQLTLSFIDIADAIDESRAKQNKEKAVILWENVEGVLKDKTNAFGIFIAGLAGLEEEITIDKWSSAGILYGKTRNVSWRILDAKYFGLPQQRRRLFVVATDINKNPENILFELTNYNQELFNYKNIYKESVLKYNETKISLFSIIEEKPKLITEINNINYEVFREYTDCLYSAYGTKWNGNAAAYNGSLYISQDKRVRRLTPLECERLMGLPDNYTNIPRNRDTNRYQAIGNSWAIPVVKWIGTKIIYYLTNNNNEFKLNKLKSIKIQNKFNLILLNNDFIHIGNNKYLNTSPSPNNFQKGDVFKIIDFDVSEKFYLSSKGTIGILRRKNEKSINMNNSLEKLLLINSDTK